MVIVAFTDPNLSQRERKKGKKERKKRTERTAIMKSESTTSHAVLK